ncbi:uncharacterized protein N7496_009313 [Penicillium cataractarum]|uniref:HAUS augmin-like complex subunit 6 N-terminal domain-containing protein n=1 Tax=Penicillium cataractarum TaxID=2100454 RepID=A0A9W9RQ39_9EURO|nr:uncharacterized protein N7496_009313 [Penicillium cataractarum]KAJ5363600.1 hypothetical protein N7496_009313 [Penicillium cataractarum]
MAASRPARPKPLDWSGPSQLAIFIRNLKLLQLDQRDNWPGITIRALSPSSQNQRQRIRLVEWSLYYLFTIWDPEGAQNKLRPFFPPLEPLQSVNLRAAIFRALSELKKNGDLGRETILRKTMLDDCKGEKFDELLAVFSTAVLRKLVTASASEMIWNPAMTLSTVSSISPTDYQNMIPLILAHQVSLNATGARRSRVQETYEQFSRLLDDKKVELTDRANTVSTQHQDRPRMDSDALAQELQTNWLGSEEWATALLDGGSQSSTDAFLELPFSKAWKQATESTVEGLGSGIKSDLVVDLEARVLRLRGRLRRWHEFSDSLRKERDGGEGATNSTFQESRLVFRDHQSLTVASISKAVRESADRGRTLNEADRSLMSSVNEAITRVNGNSRIEKTQSSVSFSETVSPPTSAMNNPQPTRPSISEDTQPSIPSTRNSPEIPIEPQAEPTYSSPPTVHLPLDHHSESDEYEEQNPEPPKPSTSSYTLVERTRKSMSLIPPLPAHESQPKRRGPRPSFPVNQFETPRKSSRPKITRSSTPQDKLFEEDADYASVFKSRPRVAHSPISSPAVHVSPSMDEDEGFELEYDETDLRDMDSPLVTSRFRG